MVNSEVLKPLEDIVGPSWVSDEKCVRDSYSIFYNSSSMNDDGSIWAPLPAAVALPKTTHEISEITKFCNENDYKVKPFSTGWIATAAAGSTRTIILDLKRMNKIIDIDVKNQIAIIEPYVRAVDLQTELWKVGLDVHMVSAGANHSILASVAAGWGYGFTGSSMGYQARNMLGVEWVMPSGEIINLGSAGDGAGWFSADGPGPGIRGAMRGFAGTLGGLGTFTKCAVKLYRWDGPQKIDVSGTFPEFETTDKLPPNVGCFAITFPTSQAMADAGYKLGEAEINHSDMKGSSFFFGIMNTENNVEFKKLWDTGLLQLLTKNVLGIAVVGYSQEEYDWKVKAMNEILYETGGFTLPLQELPLKLLGTKAFKKFVMPIIKLINPVKLSAKTKLIQKIMWKLPHSNSLVSALYLVLLRNAMNVRGAFRPTGMGGMFTTMGTFDTWDIGLRQSNWVAEAKEKYIKKGLLIDDDGDCGVGGTYENGHMGYVEGIGSYSPVVKESAIAARELTTEGIKACIDEPFGVPIAGFGDGMNKEMGPHCSDYHLWLEEIKDSLDPNCSCDSWTYVKGTIEPADKNDLVFFEKSL